MVPLQFAMASELSVTSFRSVTAHAMRRARSWRFRSSHGVSLVASFANTFGRIVATPAGQWLGVGSVLRMRSRSRPPRASFMPGPMYAFS